MLRTRRGLNSKTTSTCTLMVFSVGGQRIAARTEEVGGVWPWTHTMPVPSGTAFVNALLRRGEDVLPVFDLAARLDVALAASADEAIALLANERPDLIVSDVIMPDKSGYEVCSFVRAQESLSNTPVLLISGIVNEEVTRQAESCRADGVLKKPFQG